MKNKKKIQVIIFTVLFMAVPMTYNSCSSDHSQSEDALTSLSKTCDLESYFSRTWHPFLQQKCATCHTFNGKGGGTFADPNLAVAYESFNFKGFAKVARFAVDAGHNSPYSGPSNSTKVDSLSERWSAAQVEVSKTCGDGAIGDGRVQEDFTAWMRTISKPIGALAVGDTQEVTWSLTNDLMPENIPEGITLTGVNMKVTVEVRENLGEVYYAIFDPKLEMTDSAVADISLAGLAFRMNGEIIDNQTTFYRVEAAKRFSNRSDIPISSGSMIHQGTIRTSDVISLQIKTMQNMDLGPPPAGATVNFTQAAINVTEGSSFDLVLNLSQELSDQVSVQLDITTNADAIPVNSGRTAESRDGTGTVDIDNFDWDFSFERTSGIFGYRQTSITIPFFIRDDDRYEIGNDESFEIRISDNAIGGPAEAGFNDRVVVTINSNDGDPAPTPGIPTYSQLMSPGGVLYTNCIKCHNKSEDFGGYDITNYEQMIAEGILIPGDSTSTMFVRMNIDDPNVDTMPLDGLLPDFQRQLVEQWILNGARND